MPDATIQNVIFDVSAQDTDTLRASWQKAQARYAPELVARHIDLTGGMQSAMDQWAASYNAFNNTVRALNRQKAAWTSIAPMVRAKIKSEARTLQSDAANVAKVAAGYLTAVHAMGNPAEKELTNLLMSIARRATDHQLHAATTARGR